MPVQRRRGGRVAEYRNGVMASSIATAQWVKSSASNAVGGNCVEFASLPSGEVAVRNSRFPDGPALVFTPAEIGALLQGVRLGEFDAMTVPDCAS
ncbi:DUF397 domain-containing protein [Streptomyces sp. AA1529]|uniref:DUF397 domain-containing protein n=1 Tax=Streptomyces sp. AA1529 TaxID=1203257 RepID=UPI0006889BB4